MSLYASPSLHPFASKMLVMLELHNYKKQIPNIHTNDYYGPSHMHHLLLALHFSQLNPNSESQSDQSKLK